MLTLEFPLATTTGLGFSTLLVLVITQAAIMTIIMLQRTQLMGEILIMLNAMLSELFRYFTTFILVIFAFLVAGRLLGDELMAGHFPTPSSYIHMMRSLFTAFVGHADMDEYAAFGKIYVTIFMFIFKVLLLSLLASMFINRYKHVYNNLEAIRLLKIVTLKNAALYDKYAGGVTLSFFPINIVMTPFLLPLVYMRSPRMSDFILKIQYGFMLVLYIMLAMIFLLPIMPLIYLKCVMNALFLAATRKKSEYVGQNLVQLLMVIFAGPFIVLASLIVDLASLPSALLKDSKDFERKYALSTDRLNEDQVVQVVRVFDKVFDKNFIRFKDKYMSMIELMNMHRRIFQITDNLHDLMCRGTKDYRQSLSTV